MSYYEDDYTPLENLKINSIDYNKSDDEILINGKFKLWAAGECCSESWIEHIELPDTGETIQSMTVIELPVPVFEEKNGYTVDEKGKTHELLQLYFYRITTDKGTYDIEMRNSSNGYYGGWLDLEIIKTEEDMALEEANRVAERYIGELQKDTVKILRDEISRLTKLISKWEADGKELDEKIALHATVKKDLELLLKGRE